MKLFIAEKPSLGRAIADVLPRPQKKEDGYIRVGNGDCITWCIGHLLEQAEPEAYDPAYKKWRLEDLPIIPLQWQLVPKKKTSKQLGVIRKLVKQAEQLVHVGDPDREGQLLVDQVIEYVGVPNDKRDNTQRCLINDLNPAAVQSALQQLKSNKDYSALSTSALARSRADWLYGINMTRAYTLQGRKVGYDGLLSVGRVQTPVLGLVVRRDREIEGFVSKPYFEVLAHLRTSRDESFSAKWQPSEACEPYLDEAGRVLSKRLAENVVGRITDKPAQVASVEKKKRKQSPPLPYNLSALQIDAARQFGMSAKLVLDTCQILYERHKLVTYPRSDCRYLPVGHLKEAPAVIDAISHNCDTAESTDRIKKLKSAIGDADTGIKSKAWNDKKLEAHHAIIPTRKKGDLSKLSKADRQVYDLIARQYLCQFFPAHEYSDSRAEIIIAGGLFVASARQSISPGWKVLFYISGAGGAGGAGGADQSAGEQEGLPQLKKGENLHCLQGELLEKHTRPPEYFTDATLLAAMTGISRYVTDPEVRRVLKETDGLGTEATRAGILELLFKRGFLVREGRGKSKQIKSTAAGRGLIQILPGTATTPDMTSHWELELDGISSQKIRYAHFMDPLTASLRNLIQQSKVALPSELKGITAIKSGTGKFKRKRIKK
jgi:DNA topoisomerase-3